MAVQILKYVELGLNMMKMKTKSTTGQHSARKDEESQWSPPQKTLSQKYDIKMVIAFAFFNIFLFYQCHTLPYRTVKQLYTGRRGLCAGTRLSDATTGSSSDRDRFCWEWRGAPEWLPSSMCAGKIPGCKEAEMCLLILKVLLYVGALECLCLISVAAEWDGLSCDIQPLCYSGFMCNMITCTRRENARTHITKKLAFDLSVLDSTRSLDGLRDTVAVFQDPCGQTCDGKLIITLCSPGEWRLGGGVMLW